MAKAVIPGTFIRIRKHLVGLVQLHEPRLGVLVVGVLIRVAFLGQLPVCFFDVFLGRVPVDPQDLVIIAFRCHNDLFRGVLFPARAGRETPFFSTIAGASPQGAPAMIITCLFRIS